LRYVSHLEDVKMDDMLLSTGDGLIFPNGFALGKITKIEQGGLFYDIEVKPSLDFHTLRYCTLLTKDDIENGVES